jgi:hypothetical protein
MMETIDQQARERGVTAVDWIRHAIAFTFWEEMYLQEHLKEVGERPSDYLADLEDLCEQVDDPNSHWNQERLAREANMARVREAKRLMARRRE